MKLLNHYQTVTIEEEERELEILCLLLDQSQFKLGLNRFSKVVSTHLGERDLLRLLPIIFPILKSENSFVLPDGEYLSPKEALEMMDSILYLEVLHEELIRKSGRRSFFIANFKSVSQAWVYLALEFLLYKSQGKSARDLLGIVIGLKSYTLNVTNGWSTPQRVKSYILMTRQSKIGIFEAGTFVGFKSHKKINAIEEIQQIIFDEITRLVNYFEKDRGDYFEFYGKITGIKILPEYPDPIETPIRKERVITQLEKSLALLKLKVLPASKNELKKVFFRFAQATHPDKFEHVDKGTRTEIAIIDKFREIHSAYEFIEKKLESLDRK